MTWNDVLPGDVVIWPAGTISDRQPIAAMLVHRNETWTHATWWVGSEGRLWEDTRNDRRNVPVSSQIVVLGKQDGFLA